jgi:hypothetical protein
MAGWLHKLLVPEKQEISVTALRELTTRERLADFGVHRVNIAKKAAWHTCSPSF